MNDQLCRLMTAAACLLHAGCAAASRVDVSDGASLQRALADAAPGTTISLRAGEYVLEPVAFVDSTCGNCEDPSETVPATRGVRISGTRIRLAGADRDEVVIRTRAGYGILFEDCNDCVLRGVTVSDGERDADGRATDAAIVVRRSTVTVEDCVLRDNVGDPAVVAQTVVGIAGVAVREGGDVTVRGCAITRNSWDGIALYRGARAHIHDNVIDGVDRAAGGRVGGGRGVGIGMTWDARAVVERNRVTRYWKGIGIFVDADADVRENVVEDILTWGISLWGPDGATPAARIERNIVFETGACGVMIDRPDGGAEPGTLTDNVVMRTGLNERYDSGEPYCWQRPIARHHVPAGFIERDNALLHNRQPDNAGAAPPPLAEALRLPAGATDLMQRLETHAALGASLVFTTHSLVEVPATFAQHRILVRPVTPAGDTLVFYTDTGGGLNMIYTTTADRLDMPRERFAMGTDTVPMTPWPAWAPGLGIPAPMDSITPLAAGLVVMPLTREALMTHDSATAGFLGRHWFAGRVWTIDYPRQRLFLRPDGSLPPHKPARRVDLGFLTDSTGRRTTHFPRIRIAVEEDSLDLLFDTGATLLLNDSALAVLADGGPARRASSFISTIVFHRWRERHPDWRVIEGATAFGADLIEVPHITIAGTRVGPVWFESRPAGTFENYMSGFMDLPIVGALGGNALRFFRVTIDYPGAAAVFEPGG